MICYKASLGKFNPLIMLSSTNDHKDIVSNTMNEERFNDISEALFARVYQAYVDKNLELPSLPDAALKIREVIKNPDLGIADVARVVQIDPALTTRLIQVANSPIYQGLTPVKSVLEGVNRLGGSTTQNLAFVMAVSSLFKNSSSKIRTRSIQLYKYSAQLASLCFVIADRCENLDRERALLIGLVSHIGAIPIMNYASDDPLAFSDIYKFDNALKRLCRTTSGLVLSQWGFDPEITNVCEQCSLSQIDNEFTTVEITYHDVLIAAQVITDYKFPDSQDELNQFDEHPLQAKFAEFDIFDSAISLLSDAKQDLENSRQLLK